MPLGKPSAELASPAAAGGQCSGGGSGPLPRQPQLVVVSAWALEHQHLGGWHLEKGSHQLPDFLPDLLGVGKSCGGWLVADF